MSVETSPAPKPARRSWQYRLMRMVLIYIVTPYVAVIIIMAFAQRSFIYQPTRTKRLEAHSVLPPDAQVDDVALHAANNLTLHGWHFHARNKDGAPDHSRDFLALYFPGNAGCRENRSADCREFSRLGCDVLIFDYRGYGDNQGSPSEALLAADARRAWMFATTELNYRSDQIVLFGESMGGAMATRLAAEFSLAGTPPAALILNSTFASLGETVAWHYPAFPFQYLLLDRYPSVERIPHVTCPVLEFHGTADDVVPYQQGQRLFTAAPESSANGIAKRFVTIPGGQHNFISAMDMKAGMQTLFDRIRERRPDENSNPENESR